MIQPPNNTGQLEVEPSGVELSDEALEALATLLIADVIESEELSEPTN